MLLSSPPYVAAAIFTLIMARFSGRFQERTCCIDAGAVFSVLGLCGYRRAPGNSMLWCAGLCTAAETLF